MSGVAVLENGPFLGGFFARFLRQAGVPHRVFPAWRGVDLGVCDNFDSYILTGDMHSVAEGLRPYHRWELELLARNGGKRVFASCFSHQMLAAEHGGDVKRRASRLLGWEEITVDGAHDTLQGIARFKALCLNEDEVIRPPGDAVVLASSPGCAYQMLSYDGGLVLTCQAHPEVTRGSRRLLVGPVALALAGGPGGRYREYKASVPGPDERGNELYVGRLVRWLGGG